MLRIAVQSKGRLYDETMELLTEAGIKLVAVKRTLLVPSRNFPVPDFDTNFEGAMLLL